MSFRVRNERSTMSSSNGAGTKSDVPLRIFLGFLLLLATLPDPSLGERADHSSPASTSEVFHLLPWLVAPTVSTGPVLAFSASAVAEPSSPASIIWAVACAIGKTSVASAAMIVAAPSLVVAAEGAGKFIEDSVTLASTLCARFGKCVVRFCAALAERFVRSWKSHPLFAACVEETDEGLVLTSNVQTLFFCLASTDAIHAIVTNRPSRYERYPPGSMDSLVAAAKEQVAFRIFSPRALFASGSFARALQLCTNVRFAFDPSIGVWALVNCGAMWIKARWIPRIVVGWTASESIWRLCGAKPPEPRIGNDVRPPLGKGITVGKVQIALDCADRSSSSVLSLLEKAARKGVSSSGELAKVTNDICLALLRNSDDWVGACSAGRWFREDDAGKAESLFNKWSNTEAAKFNMEYIPSAWAKKGGGSATKLVVSLVVSIQGDSTKFKGAGLSLSGTKEVLTSIASDCIVQDGECMNAAHVFWIPSKRSEVLTKLGVVTDFPEIIDLRN